MTPPIDRAEVEREIEHANAVCDHHGVELDDPTCRICAATVALALVEDVTRKWGHVAACDCHQVPDRDLTIRRTCGTGHLHPYRDPRCAPQEGTREDSHGD